MIGYYIELFISILGVVIFFTMHRKFKCTDKQKKITKVFGAVFGILTICFCFIPLLLDLPLALTKNFEFYQGIITGASSQHTQTFKINDKTFHRIGGVTKRHTGQYANVWYLPHSKCVVKIEFLN